ncbi:MAG: hypothetical protein LBV21_03405, partial [Candidatus Adiutrix sp.]|nr:hypothetical protein [Candidatus Adiutrix sp.]
MRLRRIVLLQALGLFLLWPAAGFLAAAPVADDPELLVTLALKTAKIPAAERLKVMYLQPGADGWSTADEAGPLTAVIRAAGGLAPAAGSRGPVLDLWRDFQPDAALVRSSDRAAAEALLQQPGWREAPAARNRLVLSFPDALVDRAADFPGYFAAWLAGSLYAKQFARADQLVHPQEVISERPLELNLPYVARARRVDSRILDFVHRTLLIDFKKPQKIISTGDGALTG